MADRRTKRLRVWRGSARDPLNLNQVMLAKGLPTFQGVSGFEHRLSGGKPLRDLNLKISNLKSL